MAARPPDADGCRQVKSAVRAARLCRVAMFTSVEGKFPDTGGIA